MKRSVHEIAEAVEKARGIRRPETSLEFDTDGAKLRDAREVLCYIAKRETCMTFEELALELSWSKNLVMKAFNRAAIDLANGDLRVMSLVQAAAPRLFDGVLAEQGRR